MYTSHTDSYQAATNPPPLSASLPVDSLPLVPSVVPSFDWGHFVDMTEIRSIGTTQVFPRTLSPEVESSFY